MSGAFIEARLPECFSRGATIGPLFQTLVIATKGGRESRNREAARERVLMDISKNLHTSAEFEEVRAWFRVAGGMWRSFRVKDWSDFETAHSGTGGLMGLSGDDIVGGAGIGHGVPVYQAVRLYSAAGEAQARLLKKLVSGTATVERNDVAVTVGTGAGQIAIVPNTGRVAFVADASQAVTAVTVGATTVVTLAAALSGLAVGGRLYLTGLTGADAALLNSLSHEITNISTATYTLATNTAGKTITPAGNGLKYPQPTETLTLACEFDTPMRFDTDRLAASLDAYNLHSWGGIPLIEDLYPEAGA